MPKTPNREHGELQVESIVLDQTGADRGPVPPGGLRFVDGKFTLHDSRGDYDPRYGNCRETDHEVFDTLTHSLAENAYTEVTRSQGRLESIIVWTDASRSRKIRETVVTRLSGLVTKIETRQFDAQGDVKHTLAETVTRDEKRRVISTASAKT